MTASDMAPDAEAEAERIAEFCAFHLPALEADQVRHNIIISMLEWAARVWPPGLRTWTLGDAGQCAAMMPGRPIALAALDRRQCRALAEQTAGLDHGGVVGADETGPWFVERAAALGVVFEAPMQQRIMSLSEPPRYPGAQGFARAAAEDDVGLVAEWVEGFIREVVPHDPVPGRDVIAGRIAEGSFSLWEVGGRPVSVAAIVRRTRDTGAISSVYTPPAERGRGYAGAVTAAVVERIQREGRPTACLYTDARNPWSNRCYEKIGFRQACEGWLFPRKAGAR